MFKRDMWDTNTISQRRFTITRWWLTISQWRLTIYPWRLILTRQTTYYLTMATYNPDTTHNLPSRAMSWLFCRSDFLFRRGDFLLRRGDLLSHRGNIISRRGDISRSGILSRCDDLFYHFGDCYLNTTNDLMIQPCKTWLSNEMNLYFWNTNIVEPEPLRSSAGFR